ncbi:MAG: hypothetical protein KAI94_11545, partial [Anaerolineales bacterium]|nr:hypothetical protein [Anaerolineales bacterium]
DHKLALRLRLGNFDGGNNLFVTTRPESYAQLSVFMDHLYCRYGRDDDTAGRYGCKRSVYIDDLGNRITIWMKNG